MCIPRIITILITSIPPGCALLGASQKSRDWLHYIPPRLLSMPVAGWQVVKKKEGTSTLFNYLLVHFLITNWSDSNSISGKKQNLFSTCCYHCLKTARVSEIKEVKEQTVVIWKVGIQEAALECWIEATYPLKTANSAKPPLPWPGTRRVPIRRLSVILEMWCM